MQSGNELQTAPAITLSELAYEMEQVMYVNIGLNKSSVSKIRKALTENNYANNPFVNRVETVTTVIDGKEYDYEELDEEQRKTLTFKKTSKIVPPTDKELVGQTIKYAIQGHDKSIILSKPKSIALNVVGPHGFGKTEGIEFLAKEMGIKFMSVEPAQWTEMGEITGFPLLKEDENGEIVTKYAKVKMLFPTEEGPGILLLDDFNRTGSNILNGLMQVIQKQKLMGNFFPKGWTIMLSSNPDNDQYDVTSMDAAQLTRMSTLKLEFEHKRWVEYMLEQDINHDLLRFFIDRKDVFFVPATGKNSQSGNGNTLTVPRSVDNFLTLQRMSEGFMIEDGEVTPEMRLIRSRIVRSAKSFLNDDVVNALNDWIANNRKPMITAEDIFEGAEFIKDPKSSAKRPSPAYIEKLKKIGKKLTSYFTSTTKAGEIKEDIPYKSVFYAGLQRYMLHNAESLTNEMMSVLVLAYSKTPFTYHNDPSKDNQDRERVRILNSLLTKEESLAKIRQFPAVRMFIASNLTLIG